MKPITTVFLIFLLLSFISGIYFCATHQVNVVDISMSSFKEGFDPSQDLQGPTTIDCPDMLIKSGNSLLLFNSRLPQIPGTNPFPFYNLDEYINYLENQRKKGIRCPVLFIQEENNTQGKSVFRVRPDIFNPQGGLPISQRQNGLGQQNSLALTRAVSLTNTPPPNPIQITDASVENPPWNSNQHSGFDPTGLYIGRYTTLDALHDSTFKGKQLSENPMDTNWGGVLYTKGAVASGKYEENEVVPPSRDGIFQEKSDNIKHQNSEKNIFA
jgi:hypothetical protein